MRRRIAEILAIGAALFVAAPSAGQNTEQPPDTIAARALACANCHGKSGEGTQDVYFPRLAGKPSDYLFNQLQAFKVGRRKYPPMNYLLEFQRPEFLRDLAEYFAAQRPPFSRAETPTISADLLQHGETLVTRGDYQRNIPACTSCHGSNLTGMEPGIPGLVGLRSKYISAQIGAFRYGTRTAPEPDCMQLVAARLNEQDVIAVAAWLASRPAPANLSPAAKGSYALPFACGSEPW
jgi:cytochrome c553